MTIPQRTTGDLVAVLHEDSRDVADADTFVQALVAQATAGRRARNLPRRLLPALAAVVVVGAVAVAAVWVASGQTRQRAAPMQQTGTANAQGAALNRRLTTAETIRLVNLVTLPPGSSRTTLQPSSLNGPAMGTPGSTSLIDTDRYWRVPLSYPQAVSWMANHPPAGMQLEGTSGPTGTEKQFSGYMFPAPDSGAWVQASLQISILATTPEITVWRVDGLALWLDPRPIRDTSTGARLHVTVAAGCPSRDNGAPDVSNTVAGPADSLLPASAPSSALLCVYADINGGFALTGHRLMPAAAAKHLADLARAVSLAHVEIGPHSCPLNSGPATWVAFHYPDGSDIALAFAAGACGYLTNGTIAADVFINTSVGNFAQAIRAATG